MENKKTYNKEKIINFLDINSWLMIKKTIICMEYKTIKKLRNDINKKKRKIKNDSKDGNKIFFRLFYEIVKKDDKRSSFEYARKRMFNCIRIIETTFTKTNGCKYTCNTKR